MDLLHNFLQKAHEFESLVFLDSLEGNLDEKTGNALWDSLPFEEKLKKVFDLVTFALKIEVGVQEGSIKAQENSINVQRLSIRLHHLLSEVAPLKERLKHKIALLNGEPSEDFEGI